MRDHPAESLPRHCLDIHCRKCRARVRWYRRKAWRSHKSPIRRLSGRSDRLMTVSIPLVAIVALIVYLAYRYMGLRIWHAIACLILGFLLAATAAAPEIRNLLDGLIQWLQRP